MNIVLNGKRKHIDEDLSIAGLIERLELDVRKVAVERNLEIVSKSTFETVMVADDDRIEIVQFVGGG